MVGVWLENFGSFTFLCAVACGGWKNGNVPKCAVAISSAGSVGINAELSGKIGLPLTFGC